ncbi:competence type IV pilus ATPase ComGA [Virgibacillus dokdonensis]|uniref:Competence type IV pilus ATPase ComGA n=2 Tax=Virgibacillus TaxID=84406 RepID=A0ABU7VJW3_9BACI|nr:competence type IV pilus ATPase ComGA [Virgibacillus dokdonensis]
MNPAEVKSTRLLLEAIERDASDIHFSPLPTKTDIYLRIQSQRVFHKSIPTSSYQLLLTYYKFTSAMDIGETRKPQNGTIAFQLKGQAYDLRLSTLPVKHNESLAIRILPQQESLPLQQLFLFPQQLKILLGWLKNRSGLILINGPTGSGKTTTLYAIVEEMCRQHTLQAITLEDPIEKDIETILQVQINEKAGITYQAGFKAALRHDPDIILVGEIRDSATAAFAVEASLSGHLVLSTIHATNGLGTLYRLKSLGLKMDDLKQSLIAIASIQLLPFEIRKYGKRRAAILELLEPSQLIQYFQNDAQWTINSYHSFTHLRKKAFAYGYISKTSFEETY